MALSRRELLTRYGHGDLGVLAGLVQVERIAEAVYVHAIRSGVLDPADERLARRVLAHERVHAATLARELRARGGRPAPPPGTVAQLQRALADHHVKARLADRRTARRWLKLLADVEAMLERNYHAAIARLHGTELLTLAAEILGSEAQHSALLGERLSPRNVQKAIPNAFVNGT